MHPSTRVYNAPVKQSLYDGIKELGMVYENSGILSSSGQMETCIRLAQVILVDLLKQAHYSLSLQPR